MVIMDMDDVLAPESTDTRFEHPVFNDCDYSWDVIYLSNIELFQSHHDQVGDDNDSDNENDDEMMMMSEDDNDPLLHESYHNNFERVLQLIHSGSDVNIRHSNGCTPLICSIIGYENNSELNCYHVIELLLQNGADINVHGCYGTPLGHASARGLTGVVMLLLQHGAATAMKPYQSHPHMCTTAATTPLHYACRNHHVPIVRLLLQHGADVNAPNHVGCTPLHVAVSKRTTKHHDMIDCVKILLDHNADMFAKTACGLSSIEISFFHHHIPILLVFHEHDQYLKRQHRCQYLSTHWLTIDQNDQEQYQQQEKQRGTTA